MLLDAGVRDTMVTQLALLLIGVLSCAGEAFVVETLKLMMQTEKETDTERKEKKDRVKENRREQDFIVYIVVLFMILLKLK